MSFGAQQVLMHVLALIPTSTVIVLSVQGLAKGFIDVTGTFNYQVSPELSTTFCYKGSKIRVKNCGGIYHQWKNNKINLDVRYQTREMCWYGVSSLMSQLHTLMHTD